jgi:cytochrome c peroxidase
VIAHSTHLPQLRCVAAWLIGISLTCSAAVSHFSTSKLLADDVSDDHANVSDEQATDYQPPSSDAGYGDEYGSYDSEFGSYGPSRRTGYRPTYTHDGNYRQPVAISFVDSTAALLTTKLSGEVLELEWSPTDFQQCQIRRVHSDPSCSWGDVIVLSNNLVAIAESRAEQVVFFQRKDGGWKPVVHFATPGRAHSLAWDSERRQLIATGQWSQQLFRWECSGLELASKASWHELPAVNLGMCGGELLLLPKHNLLMVTDAFGSNYRLLDRSTGQIVKREKVYGHNITGLASVHDESLVLFPHQLISETSQSVQNEITWGALMSNNLRWLQIDRLRDQSGHDIFRKGRFYPLGTNGDGCGDPSSLAVSTTGLLAVTLGGTNRVAIGKENEYYFRQIDVGYHPVSCQFSPDQQSLIVVNQFSDSLSIVRLSDDEVFHLSLGKLRPPTSAERGEQAFFNSKLSHDGWMSCHSCHSQGHTSGQLNDNFTDHSYGTPKRILSLLGQAETAPYSWNGNISDLESQIAHSIHSTMAGDREVSVKTVADIANYIRSLPAPPGLRQARKSLTANHQAGGELFRSLGCMDCHRDRWLTSPQTYDVGLQDEAHEKMFNPPSLIGVSQRQDVLLHDGRAHSLRDLLENHVHELPHALSSDQIDLLVEYLESL